MADPKKFKPLLLKFEGGYVNNPNDKGGPTNMGITLAKFREVYGKHKTVSDLKNLTEVQWETIFRKYFWDLIKGDEIKNQSVANIICDWAFMSGVYLASKRVQRILGVVQDGKIGPKTINAINKTEAKSLFDKIKAARLAHFDAIVRARKNQAVFLTGWRNRMSQIKFEP